MRNYAKWDLLDLNKLCCFFLTKYICLIENECNFSAARHAQQVLMKNGNTEGFT